MIARVLPWLASGALVACVLGFCIGFYFAPISPRHGEMDRIIYIHVPATWIALLIFLLLAMWAGVGLATSGTLAVMVAEAMAPTGMLFAFLALWTGSLWGKPIWGVWWVWDMRLVADLVLVLFYLAIIVVHVGIEDVRRADGVASVFALLGAAIVPLTLVSVAVWPTSLTVSSPPIPDAPAIVANTASGLIMVAIGFLLYGAAAILIRLRCVILERERLKAWVVPCLESMK